VATTGVGIDVVDVDRFRLVLERRPRIVDRLFTDGERRDARSQPERLAARFAAKEAVLKALGVGAGVTPWRSIEVILSSSGAPRVVLHDCASEIADSQGVGYLHLSMTHTDHLAAAFVVGSSKDEVRGG
jgi:phosphopantetheine--protein transferase-like protein